MRYVLYDFWSSPPPFFFLFVTVFRVMCSVVSQMLHGIPVRIYTSSTFCVMCGRFVSEQVPYVYEYSGTKWALIFTHFVLK